MLLLAIHVQSSESPVGAYLGLRLKNYEDVVKGDVALRTPD